MNPVGRSARLYQLGCVLAALAVLLLVAAPVQSALSSARRKHLGEHAFPGTEQLDSFAIGLLLGGFRGPLVMYLWVESEEQKNNEQTERFLTQVKLIGDLQPQFAAMYVHQSWNLAYNVSVQYSRENEKYRWVQEGIRFIEKGVRRLPDNVDVLSQAGELYMNKLGESYESPYYKARFRQDSLDGMLDGDKRLAASPDRDKDYAARWPFIDRLDDMIVLSELNRRASVSAASVPTKPLDGRDWLSQAPAAGRERQVHEIRKQLHLADDGRHRWPGGVSVFAVAYDYYKQAFATGRPHSQFSASVVSSRPAIACRYWLRDELEQAMLSESKLWPMVRISQPLTLPPERLSDWDLAAIAETIEHYREVRRIAAIARAEYDSHTARYPNEREIYVTHLNDVMLKDAMADAGERRLAAIRDLRAAQAAGDAAAAADARLRLQDARTAYLSTARDIRDYMATEYRREVWGDENVHARAPFELLADQAQRAADQIDRLLR